MKSLVTLLLLSFSIIKISLAQNNNLVVYSQDGYKFSLILNGVLQNPNPGTNVKVTGLNATNYQAKVIFENKMPDVDGNVYLMWGGNTTQNTEYSYSITNVKGKFKLKLKSTEPVPVQVVDNPDPQQMVVMYTSVEIPVVKIESNTTNSTQTNTTMQSTNVNINIVNPIGIGIQETGTSSSSSSYNTNTNTSAHRDNDNDELPGYTGVYGCHHPMSRTDFESAKQSIASKSFDESRLTIAKQIIGSNCMLCSQIKEIMQLMSFEGTKLDLAKFAWHHNLDRGNYYKLNDAFTFESSIDELNTYTQSH